MSLEHSFRRLALRPNSICNQCRRTFASSAPTGQQQSATAAFHEVLEQGQKTAQNASRPAPQRTATAEPARTKPAHPSTAAAPPSPEAPAAATRANPTAFDIAERTIQESGAARRRAQAEEALRNSLRTLDRKDCETMMTRRWRVGDVYAPHDLTGVEMAKWKKLRRKPRPRSGDVDVMDQLNMNPLDHYKNVSIMSEYVTDMGRIRHSNDTGLRPVNQRKMAKAIRRSIGVGLMPSVYRHPELLREEWEKRRGQV
ncbi:hypothetical protein KC332_g14689 [Hortaea werneckii]|nr:hypothetical protein KC350_g17794 [Hortaea werneckii]KAI6804292.1 hypothetical protein KC358_g14740 [Hortaea werneckii]KAI6906274.1 hypothetical protein KC348_g14695 [Hortaea werneckii]KAI6923770.1 hypothetical protein KC341_g14503 [Hortaea werneckii]KAI6957320.1 hypothetical protein KC321_g14656 [Hortaea werneckii]